MSGGTREKGLQCTFKRQRKVNEHFRPAAAMLLQEQTFIQAAAGLARAC